MTLIDGIKNYQLVKLTLSFDNKEVAFLRGSQSKNILQYKTQNPARKCFPQTSLGLIDPLLYRRLSLNIIMDNKKKSSEV